MATPKQDLIAALRQIAVLMELDGENPFHCRAFETGARALEALDGEPTDWLQSGVLARTKGIGKGLTERIEEWCATGRIRQLDELRARIPPGLIDMLAIPSLGPKKVRALWQQKGITTIDALEAAARAGALDDLPGFGEKTAAKILAGIEQRRQYAARHTLDRAREAVERITERLRGERAVERLETAGSWRRCRDTIKDLDFLVTSRRPESVMDAFVTTPGTARVVARGETKSSILLESGIPVDLRVVEPTSFAAALMYFTGSKEHNTALRGRARRMGLKLNEYGLFREEDAEQRAPLPADSEAELYRHLGLAWIPPELREDMGEIEAAESGTLPTLIEPNDVRGVLHCHTTYSDGKLTVEQLARACMARGYRYLAICDHSRSAAYAGGLSVDQLRRQWDEIDAVNERLGRRFRIFKGIESDILAAGELDYEDAVLERLDLVVASIHSRMTMDRQSMTDRICRALEHPATTILGHPSGRLLLQREPYELDWERVFETAARRGVAIEINAQPSRLDLDWRSIRLALQAGCRFAICPDAHTAEDLDWIPLGVGIARKGWLAAKDVVNTLTAAAFERWLRERRAAGPPP